MKTKDKKTSKEIPANLAQAAQVVPALIQVEAKAFRAWQTANAKAKAAQKEADALKMLMGFPDTETLVSKLGATVTETRMGVIVDGNGTPLGKVSVFYRPEHTVSGSFCSRIS